jgi:diacylglycerol kinase (ATP)
MRATREAGNGATPSPPASAWLAFARSFLYAWNGIAETAVHERNMRVHLVAGLLVALLGSALPLGTSERLALLLCILLVLAAEVANSALEATVDLLAPEHHDGARVAKDAGAGFVLVLATGAVLVLAIVLVDAWPSLAAHRVAALWQAGFGLPLAVDAALLVVPRPRTLLLLVVQVLSGAALLVALAISSESRVFTAVGALLFVVCADSARRSRGGRGIVTHPNRST